MDKSWIESNIVLLLHDNGEIFERADYLPFGEIFCDDIAENGGYEGHRHKYTDQMYDYLTGLYYYGSRYYDPELGRFAQADTMVPGPLTARPSTAILMLITTRINTLTPAVISVSSLAC